LAGGGGTGKAPPKRSMNVLTSGEKRGPICLPQKRKRGGKGNPEAGLGKKGPQWLSNGGKERSKEKKRGNPVQSFVKEEKRKGKSLVEKKEGNPGVARRMGKKKNCLSPRDVEGRLPSRRQGAWLNQKKKRGGVVSRPEKTTTGGITHIDPGVGDPGLRPVRHWQKKKGAFLHRGEKREVPQSATSPRPEKKGKSLTSGGEPTGHYWEKKRKGARAGGVGPTTGGKKGGHSRRPAAKERPTCKRSSCYGGLKPELRKRGDPFGGYLGGGNRSLPQKHGCTSNKISSYCGHNRIARKGGRREEDS